MSAGLDEGRILATATTRIDALDTAGSLHDRLARMGAALIVPTLAAIERGEVVEAPQSEDGVTYARKIRPREARLRWDRPAEDVDRQIRGLSPFPGAWFSAPTEKGPVRVKALLSRCEDAQGEPGEALDDNLLIACQVGAVRILRAQREGRAPQDASDFLRGFSIKAGAPVR